MTDPVLDISGASLRLRGRELWSGLDLQVAPGEFVAVLGPSGSGKTTLLRAILGLRQLSEGRIQVDSRPVRRGNKRVGYIPQQRPFPLGTSLRARGLVALGVSGTRFGVPLPRRGDRARVDELLEAVGAAPYADDPVGSLSGGEQQRLRIGQALADRPSLLLCDEPLSSLDLKNQRAVVSIIDEQRRATGAGVVFVTHDINPVLGSVDRILYLAGGRFRLGTPDEVLRSDVLSDLYGAPVEVVRTAGRLLVAGIPEGEPHHPHHEHDHDDDESEGF
ncbi:ABC transporter ATP-binding protein [Microbacterium sorbitolivorans]|uniref:Metal ABC transporter ATP-binding protein n=1 Tax=Microbacterium sorbitolivorans TaxID=1867410 RepID=A0A367XT28_9MICO|nr:metal ABC transporter ATP-binding protein [Microbacterium sorbitolivorans]RCK56785.1 metal ABC transporter ATP-binding protein [Microbacterium sorbitolivorans]GGF50192.1 ABC transporter ATP-binding protein [Microbacterium sorbitolivorans]